MVKYLWIPYTNYVRIKLVNPINSDQELNSLKSEEKQTSGVTIGTSKPFNSRKLLEEGGIFRSE